MPYLYFPALSWVDLAALLLAYMAVEAATTAYIRKMYAEKVQSSYVAVAVIFWPVFWVLEFTDAVIAPFRKSKIKPDKDGS